MSPLHMLMTFKFEHLPQMTEVNTKGFVSLHSFGFR